MNGRSVVKGAVATAEGSEAVDLLQRLLRINTVNPPGNEQPAQELLADTQTDAGFECELLAAEETWDLAWCIAACEAEGGNLDRAREWLSNWAPMRD